LEPGPRKIDSTEEKKKSDRVDLFCDRSISLIDFQVMARDPDQKTAREVKTREVKGERKREKQNSPSWTIAKTQNELEASEGNHRKVKGWV